MVLGSSPRGGSMSRECKVCKGLLKSRHQIKYCSNKCQAIEKYKKSIENWKNGIKSGTVGIKTRIISTYLRRYLFEKYKGKCVLCGWGKRNKISGKVALEVDHINGDAENNTEENLRLICPNCHALTPHFRNLNKGNGRAWRLKKSIKI
jgi:5-methylcytosine-specific restriction endonuclease McrA